MSKRLLIISLAILLVLSALSACRREEPSIAPTEATESVTDKPEPTTSAPTEPSPTETDPPETIPPETDPPETTPPETEPPETVPFETEAIDPDILSFTPENYPKVDGSTSTKPLAKSIQEEFTGEKDVEIKHSKSHQSYLNLIDGLCDMILAVEPSPDEYAYAAEKGVTMHIEKVTNEGFVFFVNKRNPIESITTRLKRNTSIMEKMVRKGLMPTVDNIERSLNDVAGVRVVCAYIDDIYFLADALIQQDDITLVKQKDYIKNPKPNGYRSLHLIVTVPVFFATGKRDMKVEVQIRTIAMDWWASLEHQLKYKQSVENEEEIMRRLKESAETIARTDEEMLQIRKQIEQSEDIQTEDELLFERLRHFDMPIG